VGDTSAIKPNSCSQQPIKQLATCSKQRDAIKVESNFNHANLELNKLFEIENHNKKPFNTKLIKNIDLISKKSPNDNLVKKKSNGSYTNNVISDDETDIEITYHFYSESDDEPESDVSNLNKTTSFSSESPANKTSASTNKSITFRDNSNEETYIDQTSSQPDDAKLNRDHESILGDLFNENNDASLAQCISADSAMYAGNELCFQEVSDLDVQNKQAGECASFQRNGRRIGQQRFHSINKKDHWQMPNYKSLKRQMINLDLTKIKNYKLGCGENELDGRNDRKLIDNIVSNTSVMPESIIKPPEPLPDPPPEPPPIINPPDPPPTI
jgi:hypothetical protein